LKKNNQINNSLKKKIIQSFQSLKSKEDLLELLNVILQNESAEISKKKFTIKQLNYFLYKLTGNKVDIDNEEPKDVYRTFEITKKSGANRIINAPVNELELLLHCINVLINTIAKPHPKAFGFVEGKCIVDGAKIHVGKNYVYNIDLKDFFHSFDLNRVKMGFYNPPFNLKDDLEPLAYMLACLTTYNIDGKRVLPQGSPSSPSITNLLCWRLDLRLDSLAKRFGADYSRYADDITFSSNHHCFKDDFLTELNRIIKSQGLTINPAKTRLQANNIRQEVTGLTVNSKVNVTTKYLKDVRMYLYYCEQYGIEKANRFYENDYKKIKPDAIINRPPSIELFLKGKLNYLSMVKGKDDPTYLKLESRFTKLFDNDTNYVNKIIKLWKVNGIDAARDQFYKDKKLRLKEIKANNIAKYLEDFLETINSDEKIIIEGNKKGTFQNLWKKIHNRDLSLNIYNILFGWQFSDDSELQQSYNEELVHGNELLYELLVLKTPFQNFLKIHINENDIKNARKFILSLIEEDYKKIQYALRKKEITAESLMEQFKEFKIKTNS
jgi:RNA-directed DNA polymerase